MRTVANLSKVLKCIKSVNKMYRNCFFYTLTKFIIFDAEKAMYRNEIGKHIFLFASMKL